MDSYWFLFPKCQTHAYTRFENGFSENSSQKLLTKYSTEEKNKHVICRPRSAHIGRNCALVLEYGRRPQASGRTQDLWHSFSQYGPPGRQITYMYSEYVLCHFWPLLFPYDGISLLKSENNIVPNFTLLENNERQSCNDHIKMACGVLSSSPKDKQSLLHF